MLHQEVLIHKLFGYGKFVTHIIIIYFIVSMLGSASYLIIKDGYSGLLELHEYVPQVFAYLGLYNFEYTAITYSFIIWGLFILATYIKNGIWALPLFLISYTGWDGVNILSGLYNSTSHEFDIPYIPFRIIALTSIFLFIVLYKLEILNIKVNWYLLTLWFVSNYTSLGGIYNLIPLDSFRTIIAGYSLLPIFFYLAFSINKHNNSNDKQSISSPVFGYEIGDR